MNYLLLSRPKLALEHSEDYEKKKKFVDNYKMVSAALKRILLVKASGGVL
jgi:hypothetical protein